MKGRIAAAAVALLSVTLPVSQPFAQSPTRFRGGVELLPVSFLAVAEDGRPVPDLKPHEVSIRINNRERAITSLEFVRLAGANIGDESPPTPLPAPFATNHLVDAGRLIMMVVAHESIRAGKERPVREAAARFLSMLGPRDRVAVVLVPRGRVDVDFTTDHARVLASLNRIVGQAPENPSEADRLCRTRLTLHAMRDMFKGFQALGVPKTIVFVSSGLMPPKRDGTLTGGRVGWAPGACELLARDFDDAAVAASRANAHFYVVQPEDLRVDSGRPPTDAMTRVHATGPIDPGRRAFADPSVSRFASSDDELMGLQNLAGSTGGEIFRLANVAPEKVFARIARESSGYYVATVEPDPSERNGQMHRVALRVAREQVTLKAPAQITIAAATAAGDPPAPPKLLRAAEIVRDLPLRITAYTSHDPAGPGVRLLTAAEPLEQSAKLTAASFGVYEDGRLIVQSTLKPEELTSPMLAALPVRPGRYRVRVAAVDADGRAGSADLDVDARLTTAGPLTATGLALGVTRNGELMPRLEFAGDAVAVAYLEMSGRVPPQVPVSVTMEIGETLDGPPLGTIPARVVTSARDPERFAVTAAIPINGLLPGDFIVRAVISVDGKPVGRVLRTLRKR